MKIQTKADIKKISIDGDLVSIKDETIDLEFSAIDTGGAFRDPILDFSFQINEEDVPGAVESKEREISVTLLDPQHEGNEVTFSHQEVFDISSGWINGRLKGDQLDRELIGFVLQLLR